MTTRTVPNRRKSKSILLSGAALFTLSFCAITTAAAQDGSIVADAADAIDETATLDEVIVTARNRAESVQDVPLAITAFDREDFQRRNISYLDDVARLTAGLSFEDFSGALPRRLFADKLKHA